MEDRSRPLLLIVDADAANRAELARRLEDEGYATAEAGSSDAMLALARGGRLAAVVLDPELPGEHRFDALEKLRAVSDVPVMVVMRRRTTTDAVTAFELGADECVTRPVDHGELVVRLRNIVRRARRVEPAGRIALFEVDGLRIDLARRDVLRADARHCVLTAAEFDLLVAFLETPQRMMTRGELRSRLRGGAGVGDRTIDSLVRRLRRKIEEDASRPRLIKSVRGVGYVLAGAVSRLDP